MVALEDPNNFSMPGSPPPRGVILLNVFGSVVYVIIFVS